MHHWYRDGLTRDLTFKSWVSLLVLERKSALFYVEKQI